MRHRILTSCLALLVAGVASGDSDDAPTVDTTTQWIAVEQRVEADVQRKVDANLERALRFHTEAAAAAGDIGVCDRLRFAMATRDLSAIERQRRLVSCLAQRRLNEGLVAANPVPTE